MWFDLTQVIKISQIYKNSFEHIKKLESLKLSAYLEWKFKLSCCLMAPREKF